MADLHSGPCSYFGVNHPQSSYHPNTQVFDTAAFVPCLHSAQGFHLFPAFPHKHLLLASVAVPDAWLPFPSDPSALSCLSFKREPARGRCLQANGTGLETCWFLVLTVFMSQFFCHRSAKEALSFAVKETISYVTTSGKPNHFIFAGRNTAVAAWKGKKNAFSQGKWLFCITPLMPFSSG